MGTIVSQIIPSRTRLQLNSSTLEADNPDSSEKWRYTGPFTRWNRFKGSFPGLGIATVAFTIYLGYEYLFLKDDSHGHTDAGHGDSHH